MNESKIKKIISCNLKYYMDQQDVSYEHLSQYTGISIKTLQRYVRGEIIPNLERCMDISECLRIRTDQIWIMNKQ